MGALDWIYIMTNGIENGSLMFESIDLLHLGKLIAEQGSIGQMNLLKARDLARFASDRALPYSETHIIQLWQLGILRADRIETRHPLTIDGLHPVDENADSLVYIDVRHGKRPPHGWTRATEDLKPLSSSITLWFHPFRYYVLFHLQQAIKLHIHPFQMFVANRYQSMVEWAIDRFTDRSETDQFLQSINRWNTITSLVVVTEPEAFPRMFRTHRGSIHVSSHDQQAMLSTHWAQVQSIYETLDHKELIQLHQDISLHAEMLDENVKIHNIIRLSKDDDFRLKIKDRLGGAVHIRTMAEMLRRGIELACNIELLEEDDVRYGPFSQQVKIREYGGPRLFDAQSRAAQEYLRKKRLDYSVRLRWYVEGNTEFYALSRACDIYDIRDIELRNLDGRFIERKTLAFRDSLAQDMTSNIFSFISLDGDRADNVRVVRRAAEEGVFLGMFFVADPDVEFANFTAQELAELLWKATPELQDQLSVKVALLTAVEKTKNSKEFFRQAMGVSPFFRLGKGEQWGGILMEYALEHPNCDGRRRPLLEAFDASFTATLERFLDTKEYCFIDPETGKIVQKNPGDKHT